jgi:hypothetical protein
MHARAAVITTAFDERRLHEYRQSAIIARVL